MGELLFFHFPVTNVKLINEKKSFKYYSSNVCERLEIDKTPSISTNLLTVCPGVAQVCSKVGVTWMWSPIDGNLSDLRLGATSLLVPETFKSRVLII